MKNIMTLRSCLIAFAWSLSVPAADVESGLTAKGLLAAKERLNKVADELPDCGPLGLSKVLAYEEHRDFAYVLGAGIGKGHVRRIILLKPDTFVIEDAYENEVAAKWDVKDPGLECVRILPAEDAPTSKRAVHVVYTGTGKRSATAAWPVPDDGVVPATVNVGERTYTLALPPAGIS